MTTTTTIERPTRVDLFDFSDHVYRVHRASLDLILSTRERNAVHVALLVVPANSRKRGIGSAVMRELCAWADARGVLLTLDLMTRDRAWGTTSKERLRRFYRRFGFVNNRGRSIDFALSCAMYRKPRRA